MADDAKLRRSISRPRRFFKGLASGEERRTNVPVTKARPLRTFIAFVMLTEECVVGAALQEQWLSLHQAP